MIMYCQDKSSSTTSKNKDGHVTMRDKKSGALSRVQKLKKRLSHSFGRLSISKEEAEEAVNRGQLPYNGYSEEFLDRLEPNGNIPSVKERHYGTMGKRKVKRCNEKVTRNKKHINAKVVRLKKTIKKKKKKVERCYSVDQVQEALHAIGEGMSLRIAAETFGVSRSTLHRKLYSQSAIDCRKGPLSAEEEKTLVEWIIYCAERGFPVTKTHLLNCIQKFLIDYKKKTPFQDNRPGNYWYRAFMRRHNNLSQRIAQNLTTTRASVTEEDLREWFSHIKNYLEKKNLLLIEPHRIFNLDESAFMLVPKDNCVIAEKGSKSVYQITGNDKACQLREEKRKRKN